MTLSHLLNRAVLALPVVKRAQKNTRIEFRAAQKSLEDDLDREIALSNRLGKRLGLTELDVVAERGRMLVEWQANEDAADELRRSFYQIVAHIDHPSNGGGK
jgi:hypothetical protein